jgi:Fe(3+) dicitrate transport protein
MRHLVFLILFIISLNKNRLFAQDGAVISGTVLDSVNSAPIEGAEVNLLRDSKSIKKTRTDKDGKFGFRNLQEGSYQIKTSYFSHSLLEEITIKNGETVNIELRISSVRTLDPVHIFNDKYPFKTLPGTASVLSPKTLQTINPVGTQEILKYVPGVYGAADDGMGNSRVSIGIRGLDPRRSSRVLIMEDGIPIQPALYLYPFMYYNPPAERIHEIEVIKGSAAISYGPQTMGGVINYITSRPRASFGGTSQIITGNNGFLSVFTEAGGWGSATVKPEVQLLYKRANGYRENNDFYQLNGTFKVNFFFNEKKSLYLKYNVNYEDNNATYTGLTEYSFKTNPRFNPKKYDQFVLLRNSLDLIYTHYILSNLTAVTKVYGNIFKRDWWRENDVFVRADTYNGVDITPVPWYTPGNLIRVGGGKDNFGNIRKFYVAGVEQAYNWGHKLFGRKSSLETGIRYHWERFEDGKLLGNAPDARSGVYYIADSTGAPVVFGTSSHYITTALSFFAKEKIHLGQKLTLLPGFRTEIFEQSVVNRLDGNKYQDSTFFVFLPGIGLNYELGVLNFFAGVHKGYSPPSTSSLLQTIFGNSGLDVKPEQSWNYELGLRGSKKWINFETALFLMEIKDVVILGKAGRLRNLGGARTMGVENLISLKSSVWSKFLPDLNITYTLLYSEITSGILPSAVKTGDVSVAGKELPYAPRHSLVTGLSKEFKERLITRIDLTYVSRVFTDAENLTFTSNRGDTGPVPSYYLLDATINYKINKNWKVFAVGKNILDNIYIGSRLHSDPYPPSSNQNKANTSSGIIPGARRQVSVGFRYEF